MFEQYRKKEKKAVIKPRTALTEIHTSSQLLQDNKREELINNISDASALDCDRFKHIGLPLIHQMVHYYQHLPETVNRYYALPGGRLDHALNRTDAALSIVRQVVIQGNNLELSEEQKLWVYALFTASMLRGIGQLYMDYHVDLFDANGAFLKQWSPLLESMSACGHYYQFEFKPEGDHDLSCRLNVMLARTLMPADGFAWIISNPEVLTVWLALLSDDARGAGTLGAVFIRADAIAIQRDLNDWLKHQSHHEGRFHRISTFVDTTPESTAEKEKIMGIEFLKWLTNQLQTGQLMMNKVPLLMVQAGMLMSNEVFQWFVREHPDYRNKNWQAVQRAFLSLGLHQVHADGSVISRVEQANSQQMHSGVLFKNYAVALPERVHLQLPTGESRLITAMELIHSAPFEQSNVHHHHQEAMPSTHPLKQLSLSGQWVNAAKQTLVSLMGTPHRG